MTRPSVQPRTGALLAALALSAAGCVPAGGDANAPRRWVSPATGIEFVRLPAGRFRMGSPPDEPGRGDDETAHSVTLARPFWMATTEVTQAQWRRLMGTEPSHFAGCPDCPVESVSFDDVQGFLARLYELEPQEGYRLPREAEWEYACRACSSSAYASGGRLLAAQANFDARYPLPGMEPEDVFPARTLPVGSYPANAWGLFDMHGNVWEWTADRYCPYPASEVQDPRPDCDEERLVIRGGSWTFGADAARCAMRYTHLPVHDGYSIGFRLVREQPES